MEQFPFTIDDVLRLLNINHREEKSIRITCPFCMQGKINRNLGIAMDTEKFHCYSCGVSGRGGTQFYAYHQNLTTKEAYKEIMTQLGLSTDTNEPIKIRERKIYEKEINVEAEIASDIVLNSTYRTLLDELHLSKRDEEDLYDRGFTKAEILTLGYKSYPSGDRTKIVEEYFNIPKKLLMKNCTLQGVPGFYTTKNKNVWTMCWRKSGILVPYISYENRIVGFQLRKHDEELDCNVDTGERENKYSWISSADKNNGCRVSTSVHYSCDFEWSDKTLSFSPIIQNGVMGFTEGAMKGDLYHCITGRPVMSVPGCGILGGVKKEFERLKEEKGVHTIAVIYDMDYLTNPNVEKDMNKLKDIIKEAGLKYIRPTWNTMIGDESLLKGVDDYYAYKQRGIVPVKKEALS